MNSAVAALYTYRDTLVKSCVTSLEDVLKTIRLTQSFSAQIASEMTELHPITGYVLCFCKEIISFETIYQELLEIAREINCPIPHLPTTTIGLESFVIDALMIRLQVFVELLDISQYIRRETLQILP
jgi:hypothetical protein